MQIYLDLIFLLNFLFDFLLLTCVSVILRRNVKLKRIFLGAFAGSLSIFLLFLKINNIELFILKIMISLVMVLLTFEYRDLKYTARNLLYLYTSSILLGGFLYLLNVEFSYKQDGLIFYHSGLSINWIVLLLLGPFILYLYGKQALHLKYHYSNYYQVDIYFKDGLILSLNGYMDSGNKLYDPYRHRPIVLMNQNNHILEENYIFVPYDALNYHGLLKCIPTEKIHIHGVGTCHNVLVGISESKIKIDGIDCILHSQLLEG